MKRYSPLAFTVAAAAYVLALTPSLIPRGGLLQGLTTGVAFAVVYGVVTLCIMGWAWLGLSSTSKNWQKLWSRVLTLAGFGLILFGLSQATFWQQITHSALGLPPPETARPLLIAAVSVPVAALLILLGKLFQKTTLAAAIRLQKIMPPRLAGLIGFALAIGVFWLIGNGLIFEVALRALDSTYRRIDAALPTAAEQPSDPLTTGGPGSLVAWDSLGRQGINTVLARPNMEDLKVLAADAHGVHPLRIYVGLNSAENVEARAQLALDELIRVRAFDRPLLVITTPTGTGWIDPAALAPLEVLHDGNVATVAVQYSYLPSWLSLFVEPEYGAETARAVFNAIYGYWRELPKDKRPRLYLFGLSLGSLNSDLSVDLFNVIADPIDGAFWVGPPYASRTWWQVTKQRNTGSPAWLPTFRDGSLIRFASQFTSAAQPGKPWGPMRIIYLQYASDPITFFDSTAAWRSPAWLESPRGPDVSPQLRWIPLVSVVQLAVDAMTGTTTPIGTGHVYSADHYLDGWMELTRPADASPERITKIRVWLRSQGLS